MKAPFKYQPEFSGISIFALCAAAVSAALRNWEWILICVEAVAFDVHICALAQYMKWRKS